MSRFASEVTTQDAGLSYRPLLMARFSITMVTALFNDHPRPEREVVKQSRSEKLFNADDDPLFVQVLREWEIFSTSSLI